MSALKLEILFVSHKYPPSTGGMERQSYELIEGMREFVKVHKLVYTQQEHILSFFYKLNRRILDILERNPAIKIIHFNDGLIATLALFHKGYAHIKRVVTVHGLDITFPLGYFQHKIIPRFEQFDHIIAVSNATAQALVDRGVASHKISVINNGVDHDWATPAPCTLAEIYQSLPEIKQGKKYVVTLGRAVKRKGGSWLLEHVIPHISADFQLIMVGPFAQNSSIMEKIIQILPNRIYTWLTLFLGYPSDQIKIRKLLKIPHIAEKAVHVGKIDYKHLKTLLAHSSAFLMPNIRVDGDMEGFGLVCLEASLSGATVFVSSIEGITDAISHQNNGILLKSGDAQAWIDQLDILLKNPAAYDHLAQEFKTYSLQHYSWKKMCMAHDSLFRSILSDRPVIYSTETENISLEV